METIFALSSGKGKAGVAIVRISGNDVNRLFDIFSIKKPKPRIANLQKLKHPKTNQIIDNCLVLYFEAPNSFTGENTVELHLHGSIAVVEEVLETLSKIKNYRLAEAGEFSKRAFENNKLDLVQAEGLADLIEAETAAQKKQAIKILEGNLSNIFDELRNKIIEIMAFIEAFVDFPDEDIPQNLDIQAQEKVLNIIKQISELVNNNRGEKLRQGAVATIIGEPNSGKSTLLNYLCKREIAIVSDIAGTTRDSIEAHLNINGYPLTIIDTAGIRETQDKIEKEGVRRALEKAKNADFKIILIDAENNIIPEGIKNLITENDIIVISKCDLITGNSSAPREKVGSRANLLKISVQEDTNLDLLLEKITEKLKLLMDSSEQVSVSRARHKAELTKTNEELENFIQARKNNLQIELCAENLRQACYHLGKITGKIGVEDLLDKIFSEFCIGK